MEKNLRDAFDKFENARLRRLQRKEDEGYDGWDNTDYWDIKERMFRKAVKITFGKATKKDCVDVANFVNFIFDDL